jgi:methylthioribose-1-phosphate isomerase
MKFKTIEWKKNSVRILDQRKLPLEVRYLECRDSHSVAQAIRTLTVRGWQPGNFDAASLKSFGKGWLMSVRR